MSRFTDETISWFHRGDDLPPLEPTAPHPRTLGRPPRLLYLLGVASLLGALATFAVTHRATLAAVLPALQALR